MPQEWCLPLSSGLACKVPQAMAAKRSQPPNVTADAISNILFDTIPDHMISRLSKETDQGDLFKLKFRTNGRVEEDMLIF
jgi:hypothetical protein